ncbi:MAG TPA: peptidoglycan editing factor PgeF [Gammaproteobacteria bacterium]|nr:peptidoglycan editing factor PgeF [Gammaproteobacteria bacterium]
MTTLKRLEPDWSVDPKVHACITTRQGGYSQAPFHSLNLGSHVNDNPKDVAKNRAHILQALQLPARPHWLNQVHGTHVFHADHHTPEQPVTADASVSRQPETVCAILTADCLPVFFAAVDGSEIGIAHAGWRGLASGILEATLQAMTTHNSQIAVWMGPAIGPDAFEVGEDVRNAFVTQNADNMPFFKPNKPGHYHANLYQLATLKLNQAGVTKVSGGDHCTYSETKDFFSYRREKETGRMASLIWIK